MLIAVPGRTYRVPYSGYVRRRIAAGDLIPTTRLGAGVSDLKLAAAPEALELAIDGSISDAAAAAEPSTPSTPSTPTI